jgi:5-formyltetrahydrofolate cyclo-ligase
MNVSKEVAVIKKSLRKDVLTKRQALSPQEVGQKSDNIHKRLFQLKYFQDARVIMVYVDFRNEVKTTAIITNALNQGKRVVIPVCRDGGQLIPAEVYQFPEDLEPGTWGILEPKPGRLRPVEPGEIELVLVPGVAFDQRGNRLGYGAGYYDRFLAKTSPTATSIALAYELQAVEDVFPVEHDMPVHYILTEDRLILCRDNYPRGGNQ